MESLQEGVVIDESAEILEQPVAVQSSYSCGLPYYRWLHPHAKTTRLQYFNQILPDIYARTAHLLPEYESFDDLVKTELPRRWRDKEILQALRRRLFVATKCEFRSLGFFFFSPIDSSVFVQVLGSLPKHDGPHFGIRYHHYREWFACADAAPSGHRKGSR